MQKTLEKQNLPQDTTESYILNKSDSQFMLMCLTDVNSLLFSLTIGSSVALALAGIVFFKRTKKPEKLEVES